MILGRAVSPGTLRIEQKQAFPESLTHGRGGHKVDEAALPLGGPPLRELLDALGKDGQLLSVECAIVCSNGNYLDFPIQSWAVILSVLFLKSVHCNLLRNNTDSHLQD